MGYRSPIYCLLLGVAAIQLSCVVAVPTSRDPRTRPFAAAHASPQSGNRVRPPVLAVVREENGAAAVTSSPSLNDGEENATDMRECAASDEVKETTAELASDNAPKSERPGDDAGAQSDSDNTERQPSASGNDASNQPNLSSDAAETADQPDSSSPLDEQDLKLNAAPVEESDRPLPINLATALSLSDARPLVVAAAQASAWVAEAQLQRAQVIWIPEFDLGVAYMRHDGFGPDFNRGANNPAYGIPGEPGGPLNQNLNWLYGGISFFQIVALTDAIFEPLAARQVLDAARWDIQTAKNDALLETARAYFTVHQYRGQYAALLDVVNRGQKLVDRIELLTTDLVPRVEFDRAKQFLASAEQQATRMREEWRIASANLTEILRLDPSAVVVPMERDHLQITLVDPAQPVDDLIRIGLHNRPELAAKHALRQAAQVRIRREKYRPLIPTVLFTGFQTPGGMRQEFGIFGTGSGSSFNQWSLRDDFSAQLVWQLEGLGFGNLARIKEQRGEESRVVVKIYKIQDQVAAEITQAQAVVQSAAVRVEQAERSLREGLISYQGNYEGLEETQRFGNVLVEEFRPQEAVAALEQLVISYREYFATVADYNRAQFELYHALGYPARQVTDFQPPGEILSIDLNRPFGLPLVGHGPPPADR